MSNAIEAETFTPAEAAKILKCSSDQVRNLIVSGRLSATNTSLGTQRARWVITRESIDRFLSPPEKASKRHKPPPASRKWI